METFRQRFRVELPEFKRCCCCIPLRYGLLTFVYAKLGLLLLCAYFIMYISLVAFFIPGLFILFLGVTLAAILTDIGFSIVFTIGAHKKNHRILRVYYYFALVCLGLYTLTYLLLMGNYIHAFISYHYPSPSIVEITCITTLVYLIVMVVQTYVTLLVRSEILKLKSNCKFEFLNHAAEAEGGECRLEGNVTISNE